MTMLERAARAVGEVVGYRGDDIITKDSLAMDIARAVLMAVREPDFMMKEDGNVALSRNGLDSVEGDDSSVCFTAMIDAILNEKPEGLSDV